MTREQELINSILCDFNSFKSVQAVYDKHIPILKGYKQPVQIVTMVSETLSEDILDRLLVVISECYMIPVEEIVGISKKRPIVDARHAFHCLAVMELFESKSATARKTNKKHSTVDNSLKELETCMMDILFAARFKHAQELAKKIYEDSKTKIEKFPNGDL